MIRRIAFHPAAGEEAEQAAAWYASEALALGFDFVRELARSIDLLKQEPIPSTPYPRISSKLGIRRLRLQRFPFDLVFIEREENFIIVALAHHARRPGYGVIVCAPNALNRSCSHEIRP